MNFCFSLRGSPQNIHLKIRTNIRKLLFIYMYIYKYKWQQNNPIFSYFWPILNYDTFPSIWLIHCKASIHSSAWTPCILLLLPEYAPALVSSSKSREQSYCCGKCCNNHAWKATCMSPTNISPTLNPTH